MKSTADESSLRRLSHVSTFMLVFYYWLPEEMLGVSKIVALLSLTLLIVLTDIIRMIFNIDIPGQRWYEKKRLSALAWVFIGASMVITIFPAYLVIPSILCMAFVDPILALRRERGRDLVMITVSFMTAFFIFLLCLHQFSQLNMAFALLLSILAAFITIISEEPSSYHIDDDFLLIVVPPSVVYLVILTLAF